MEKNINETDFEELSLESLRIDTSSITTNLSLSPNDERLLLYQNHQLAKTLLTSTDNNLKFLFKNTMRTIFDRYLREIAFNNNKGQYNDMLRGMSERGQIEFFNQMTYIKELIIDYIKNSTSYSIEFALNKVIEITKYFIEFINPMYPIQLDLSLLQL